MSRVCSVRVLLTVFIASVLMYTYLTGTNKYVSIIRCNRDALTPIKKSFGELKRCLCKDSKEKKNFYNNDYAYKIQYRVERRGKGGRRRKS